MLGSSRQRLAPFRSGRTGSSVHPRLTLFVGQALPADQFESFASRGRSAPPISGDADLPAFGTVSFQPKTTRRLGSNDQTHRLRTLELPNSQVKIVFSREDLSYALLDRPWFNTNGYSTKSARSILHRLIYGFTPQ